MDEFTFPDDLLRRASEIIHDQKKHIDGITADWKKSLDVVKEQNRCIDLQLQLSELKDRQIVMAFCLGVYFGVMR